MKWRVLAGYLALLIALLPVLSIPVAAQSGQLPALPIAEIGTRPRLLIPHRYLQDTLQPRLEDNVASWQALKAYVTSATLFDDLMLHPEAVIHALGLAWLLTGETSYYDRAIFATQYLINAIEDAPAMRQPGSQWQHAGLQQLAALAVAYDWFYTLFRPDDRRIIADVLLRAASRLQDPRTAGEHVWVVDIALDPAGSPDTYWFAAFNSESVLWLWALTATVLALQGEYPEVSLMIDRVRNLWTGFMLPALALQPNGAWAGGPVDGFTAGWWLSQTALAWWTARGENYFDDTDWWVQRPAYNTLMYYPLVQPVAEPTTAVLGYPNIIGDGARNDPGAAYGHAQDLLLAAVLPDTPYAPWVNWIAQQTQLPPWLQVETLLWHDPHAGATVPDVLSWRAFGTNHVFLRSHWIDAAGGLDSNAMVVTLQAGDHFAPRQFFDQGNFTIWRGGVELLTRGGVYSGGDSHHDANYYARTIGGNTILICDLAEIFDGIRPDHEADFWLNDCGQRAVGPGSYAAINHQFVLANRRPYDTANITRVFDSAALTYIQSDLTAAYNSTLYTTPGNRAKVELVEREFVYIRPGAVVVYDRVHTLSPDFTTLDTFHFSTRPQFDGTSWMVRDGNSILYFQQLVPDSSTQIVDGYITAGQLVASAPGQQRAGWNRLDIFPPTSTTTPWFLHTFVVTDAASVPPLPALLIVGESMRGAVVNTPFTRWQVMFDDDPQNVTRASFSIEAGIQALFLTGLAPARAYLLHWANGLTERRTTDGAGTLLLQNPIPSLFELELAE